MSTRTSRLEFLLSLTDKVSSPLSRITQRFENLQKHAMGAVTKIGAGIAGLAGAGMAVANGIQPARDVAASLGEVQSLGVAADELKRLENQALLSSAKYGTAAAEFVGASYDIQSAIAGLKPGQLGVVTESMDALAVATKADVAGMTSLMGGMYGIFQDSADKMGVGKFSQQVAAFTAKSVQMFKTTGKGMEDAFRSVGSLAQANGIAMANQFAVMGTLQATMPGAEAGTKYKAFLAGVLNAQDKLKMKFTDSKGAMLPMVDILEKIKARYGDLDASEISQLSKGFGSQEAVMVITGLLGKTEQLKQSIADVSNADFSLVEKMALAIADPFAKAGAGIESVTAKLGLLFLPQINGVMEAIAGLTQKIMGWIDANPELSKTLTKVGFGVLAVVAGIATLAIIAGVAPLAMAGVGLALSALFAPVAFLVAGVATLAFVWGELSKRSGSADGLIDAVKFLAGVAWKQIAAFVGEIGDGFRSIVSPLLELIPAGNSLASSLSSLGESLSGPTTSAENYGRVFGKVLAYLAGGVVALKTVMIAAAIVSRAWAAGLFALAVVKKTVAIAGVVWNAVMVVTRALVLATLLQVNLLRGSTVALAIAQRSAAVASFLFGRALAAGRAIMLGMAAAGGVLKAGLLLALSPIGLVVGAVVGLIAAGIWLYKNWESVKATLSESAWGRVLLGIIDSVGNAVNWLFESWESFVGLFSDVSWSTVLTDAINLLFKPFGAFQWVLESIQSIWEGAKAVLADTSWGQPILDFIAKISAAIDKVLAPLRELKEFAGQKIEGISAGVEGAVNSAGEFVGDTYSTVTNYFWGDNESPKLGTAKARGGDVRAGYMHRVNEYMPELLSISGQTFLMMGAMDGKVRPLPEATQSRNLLGVKRQDSRIPELLKQSQQNGRSNSRQRPTRSLSVNELHIHTQAQDIDGQAIIAALNQAS